MVTLEIAPAGRDRFDVYLDGELLLRSRQPLFDGARELLRRGVDPATPLTARHRGAAYDAFRPAPLGRLAKLTLRETDRDGLRLETWRAFPSGGAKDPRGAAPAPPARPERAPLLPARPPGAPPAAA